MTSIKGSTRFQISILARGANNKLFRAGTVIIPDGCGPNGTSCEGVALDIEASDIQLSQQEIEVWVA
ncbi:MAG: hypothetical protein HRU06_14845 [Oceanospirillaceae bacterium]|nr:hypothetical protein [Oceanospirillaceae bacterium]